MCAQYESDRRPVLAGATFPWVRFISPSKRRVRFFFFFNFWLHELVPVLLETLYGTSAESVL